MLKPFNQLVVYFKNLPRTQKCLLIIIALVFFYLISTEVITLLLLLWVPALAFMVKKSIKNELQVGVALVVVNYVICLFIKSMLAHKFFMYGTLFIPENIEATTEIMTNLTTSISGFLIARHLERSFKSQEEH